MLNKPSSAVPSVSKQALQVDEAQRGIMNYNYETNRLLVAKQYSFTPFVRGYIAKLQRLGIEPIVEYVDPMDIQEANRKNASLNNNDSSPSEKQASAKKLFHAGVENRASDIHIRVGKQTEILFRIHNDLELIESHPREYGEQLCMAIYQAMSDISDATFEIMSRQDARISERSKLPPELDGIRIATSPQVDGFIMVMRLLYNDTVGTDLASLGFMTPQINAINFIKRKPHGINIIAGPTGSGKSTTLQYVLYSLVQETGGKKHIITVEDPPEYPIPGVVQTPVTNAVTEEDRIRAFQEAIKAAMRLDPDIIMIGEVRDQPSARLAVQAAMTGHQVWTTVHANTAFATVDRMIDLGVPEELIYDPGIITGLSCQRLVKVLCKECRKPFVQVMGSYSENAQRRLLSVIPADALEHVHVKGDGCPACRGKGITGRSVVNEQVITDERLMSFLRNRDRIGALTYWKEEQGGLTMLDHALTKITEGFVDPFDAEKVVGPLNLHLLEHGDDFGHQVLKGEF